MGGLPLPEQWIDLTRDLISGDPTVGPRLVERERRFFNHFAETSNLPLILKQPTTAITQNITYVYAHRDGRWAQVTGAINVTGAGTASSIFVDLPPEWMAAGSTTSLAGTTIIPCGNFSVFDASVPMWYHGTAFIDVGGYTIHGRVSGNLTRMGVAAPAAALAVDDAVVFNIRYPLATLV